MGTGDFTGKVSSDASFHAVHVRRRCADLQYGDSLYATVQPVQERGCYQHRICPIRPIAIFTQVIQDPIPPKDSLHSRELDDTGAGAIQVQFYGSAADGNRGLASVRDSGAVTRDIFALIR